MKAMANDQKHVPRFDYRCTEGVNITSHVWWHHTGLYKNKWKEFSLELLRRFIVIGIW